MTLIIYPGRGVAIAGRDCFYVAPHFDRLPDRNPLRAFTLLPRTLRPQAVTGELPGELWRDRAGDGDG